MDAPIHNNVHIVELYKLEWWRVLALWCAYSLYECSVYPTNIMKYYYTEKLGLPEHNLPAPFKWFF